MIDELGNRSEAEIVQILGDKVQGADAYNQSEQAKQRQDNLNMYYLNPLQEVNENQSQFQSSDVFDAVEGTKAVIHEALTSGRDLLHFEPLNDGDVDLAKMANRYVKDRFLENDGYRFLIDSLHDGLLAKNAVCKYGWMEDSEEKIEPFVGIPKQQLMAMLAQDPQIQINDENYQEFMSVDPQTGMEFVVSSGSVIRTINTSKIDFTLIKPEDFFGDESASSDEEFTFASDREVFRKGELLEDYPHLYEEIKNAPKFNQGSKEIDGLVRRGNDDSWRTNSQAEKAWERDPVEVYNCHIALWGKEGYGIYYYKMLDKKTLLWDYPELEEGQELPEGFDPADGVMIDEIPYLVWSPYPLSHRWDGIAQADAVRDIQLAATNLKSSMINHSLRTNNPMRQANMEFIRNPEDLVDNNIGAVIDTDSVSGQPVVTPIIQPQMDASVFNTLAMVRADSEQRSSYSGLAGGLDGKALSNQNSADLIAKMTDSSNRRIMMMARNFVELYLKKLYLRIYKLGVANDKEVYEVELNGNWVEMSPSEWPERPSMKVITSMTPEAAAQSAMNKLQLHQVLMADPETMLMYRTEKRFNLYADVFHDIGEVAVDRYLENPQSEEFQAAQQNMIQGQQQQQQAAQEAQMRQERILDKQIQLQELQVTATIDQGQQKIDNEAAYNADKQSLDEDKFEEEKDVNEAEITLETIKVKNNDNSSGVSIG